MVPSSRSVLPWDWLWGDRPASRWSPRETSRNQVCERTGAQGHQVRNMPHIRAYTLRLSEMNKWLLLFNVLLKYHLICMAFLSLSTEAGRETSGGMWRTEKMSPAGSFTVMEQASSMEMQQTTLCRGFLKLFKNRLQINVQKAKRLHSFTSLYGQFHTFYQCNCWNYKNGK